jgi:uncharacterized membrane protein
MPRFDTPPARTAYRIVAALLLIASGLGLAAIARDPELLHETLVSAGLSVAFFGKYIVLGGFDGGSRLGPYGLALLAFAIDVDIAVLFTSGAQHLERVPGVGRWLRYLRTRARRALNENPGLSNMAFWGVALYVFVPLPGTGAFTGTLAARILGISRLAGVAAVGLGAGAISFAFALVAAVGKQHGAALGPELLGLGLAIVVLSGWLVIRRARQILRKPH